MAAEGKHYARRPLPGYGPAGTPGVPLDQGQVVTLQGLAGDERLLRLGFFEALPRRATTHACPECGAEFVDLGNRERHARKRHPVRPRQLTPDQEDAAAEREASYVDETAPVRLENTAASRK